MKITFELDPASTITYTINPGSARAESSLQGLQQPNIQGPPLNAGAFSEAVVESIPSPPQSQKPSESVSAGAGGVTPGSHEDKFGLDTIFATGEAVLNAGSSKA